MGAAGNKQPKKEKSGKHSKHVPSYQTETPKADVDDLKKKQWLFSIIYWKTGMK